MPTMSRECPTGKVPYRTADLAAHGAQRLAQKLNGSGKIARDLYTYRCSCGWHHLTRARKTNRQVFKAALPWVQVELMHPKAREKLHRRNERRYARLTEEAFKDLPDPLPRPVKQPYANRPRHLRHG